MTKILLPPIQSTQAVFVLGMSDPLLCTTQILHMTGVTRVITRVNRLIRATREARVTKVMRVNRVSSVTWVMRDTGV